MKNTRLLTVLAAICLILVLALSPFLVSCSGSAPAPAATSAPVPATSAAPAPKTSAPAPAPSGATTQAPATAAAASTIKLTLTHHQAPTTRWQKILEAWTKMVSDKTNGRVQITIYPVGTVCAPADTYDALLNGLVDIAVLQPAFNPGRFPLSEVIEMPSSPWSPTIEMAGYVCQKLWENGDIAGDWKAVRPLWFYDTPGSLFHLTVPVRKVSDLKGLRIRVTGSVGVKTVQALGASAVAMPPSDAYLALQKGIVEAATFAWVGIGEFRLNEVVKYHLNQPIKADIFNVSFNAKKWDALPADIQTAIKSVSGMTMTQYWSTEWGKDEETSIAEAKKLGHEIINLPPEEVEKWQAMVKPIWTEWADQMKAKGLPGKELQDAATKYAQEYKK